MKQTGEFFLGVVSVDAASPVPLYRQIYDGIRAAILSGALEPGLRLPSTRDFAGRLGLSRNTVKSAFEQLIGEGFLIADVGSGTRVTRKLPAGLRRAAGQQAAAKPRAKKQPAAKQPATQSTPPRSRAPVQVTRFANMQIGPTGDPAEQHAFRAGMPALDLFPFEQWGRLAAQYYRKMPLSWAEASPVDPLGFMPLRRAIAAYLKATRGVRCDAQQVIVTTGTQQALYLAAQILLSAGDAVWIEDPGYLGARHAFSASGAVLTPVPVDAHGLDVDAGIRAAPKARAVYTTPAHQFPLGVPLSLERRLALLRWADASGAWIIEDDYDGDFRYQGFANPALQGLVENARVIYMGSFNKALFPGLRLGYLIAPEALLDAFAGAMEVTSGAATITNQVVLTDFFDGGHFQRHIRRMRVTYAERVEIFAREAARLLGAAYPLGRHDTGMHFTLHLPAGMDDLRATRAAAVQGIETQPLSRYAIQPLQPAGLLLGCCAVPPAAIPRKLALLAHALRG
jgi:GntR family transcriptional regulator / MocR family aminotransferase